MSEIKSRRASPLVRLDRAAWIEAANSLLIHAGVEAIKIEPLAASLAVTKGSFYWHFKDRAELLDAILDDWQRRLTLAIIDHLETSGKAAAERLHALLAMRESNLANNRDAEIELAIRLWARSDARARAVIRQTDELRLNYFEGIFNAYGDPPHLARTKAVLAYSYMRVAGSLLYGQDGAELAYVESILLAS